MLRVRQRSSYKDQRLSELLRHIEPDGPRLVGVLDRRCGRSGQEIDIAVNVERVAHIEREVVAGPLIRRTHPEVGDLIRVLRAIHRRAGLEVRGR